MTEADWWRSTPRKLAALTAAHNRVHDDTTAKAKPRKATLADFGAIKG